MVTQNKILDKGFPSLREMATLLRSGGTTSVELTTYALKKIKERDSDLHAFVGVYEDEALLAAKAADNQIKAGYYLGPLHGIPIALKDNIDILGRPSTAGSSLRKGDMATQHAWITQRLLECGAVIIGKTHMVEFALGAWGANEIMGAPKNPWGKSEHLSPGGSSSGSAVAVAAGMVPLAIGTDTGASVRVPASLCGVTGFKPTIHRLKGDGVVPLSTTLDSVGIISQTAEDASLMFSVLAKDERSYPLAEFQKKIIPGIEGLRIGYLAASELDGLQLEIKEAYESAINKFRNEGASLRPLTLPISLDSIADIQSSIMLSEAAASWSHLALDESLPMDSSVRPRIIAGSKFTAMRYVDALRKRDVLKIEFSDLNGNIDAFITPTTQWTARPLNSVDHSAPPVRYARIAYLLDLCGISIQSGVDSRGLPIGLQIVGANGADADILSIARSYQRSTDWHLHRCV